MLLVDDHAEVRSLVCRALERDGHVVAPCANAARARALLAEQPVDLIVLDIGLPDGSGLELCRAFRRAGETAPILLLTARNQVETRVEGLDAGADDFLGKPFAVAELRARVRALGRRGARVPSVHVRGSGFSLDLGARRAVVDGDREVPLTAREWTILEALASRQGARVWKSELVEMAWGSGVDDKAAVASLEVIIGRIRRKLGEGAIRTIRGEGYALGA